MQRAKGIFLQEKGTLSNESIDTKLKIKFEKGFKIETSFKKKVFILIFFSSKI